MPCWRFGRPSGQGEKPPGKALASALLDYLIETIKTAAVSAVHQRQVSA